jgi:hypothetical protein
MYPPKKQFLAILQVFAWAGILCPLPLSNFGDSLEAGILCPLQLSNFWQFFGSFVSRLIFCAPLLREFLAILAKFWESGRFLVGSLVGKLLFSPIFERAS